MSDMARIPLELGLRADANWFHDARRTTGINNRQTGPGCPMTAGDSHLFGGASSGASWCIDGILCCKNKILGSEFRGYTAHHFTASKHFHRHPGSLGKCEKHRENSRFIVRRRPQNKRIDVWHDAASVLFLSAIGGRVDRRQYGTPHLTEADPSHAWLLTPATKNHGVFIFQKCSLFTGADWDSLLAA
jgi:hypothetical protein